MYACGVSVGGAPNEKQRTAKQTYLPKREKTSSALTGRLLEVRISLFQR